MHAPCPRAVVDEHVDHKNDLTCIMNLQPWTNCVGKWQKHELVTVIPIKQVPSPQIPLAMLKNSRTQTCGRSKCFVNIAQGLEGQNSYKMKFLILVTKVVGFSNKPMSVGTTRLSAWTFEVNVSAFKQ